MLTSAMEKMKQTKGMGVGEPGKHVYVHMLVYLGQPGKNLNNKVTFEQRHEANEGAKP